MKIKSLFIAALAMVALVACNKKEVEPINEGTTTMSLKIDAASFTRAIQDPAVVGDGDITSLTAIPAKEDGTILPGAKPYVLDAADITIAKTHADGKLLENFPGSATHVLVYANYANEAKYNNITEWQGIVSGAMPLTGLGKIVDHTNATLNAAGAKLAVVTLERPIARVEVIGGIAVDVATNGVARVDVKNVYINKYKQNRTDAAVKEWKMKGAGLGVWEDVAVTDYGTNKLTDAITDGKIEDGKAAAYQLFPTDLFQVVLEVEIFLTEQDVTDKKPMEGRKFINIDKFKLGTADLTAIAANNVYTLNLDGLKDSFKKNDEDPTNPTTPTTGDPNAGVKSVYLKVSVNPWTLNTITPDMN